MTRTPRSALPDGFFHVTARGVRGLPIFLDDADRHAFFKLFSKVVPRLDWICHAYCLMSNHYHLVLATTVGRLSRGMHAVNGRYAQRFNRRYELRGHVFEARFDARVIADEEHLQSACVYVAANPVRAGLCERPDDWPWSWTRS